MRNGGPASDCSRLTGDLTRAVGSGPVEAAGMPDPGSMPSACREANKSV